MKILYVSTISNTVNAFLIPHIKMLIDAGHKVDVAFKIEQEIRPEVYKMGCKVHQLPLRRSPLSKDNIKAYKMLKNIVVNEGYDLVHTHTPVASAIVRLVCRNINNVKVFYTAHGFHFYKGAPLVNWLIYYPIEKWLARYTDVLITINKEDYERAKKKFKVRKIEYVPGVGIDIERINVITIDKDLKRQELKLTSDAFVIISVGELNKNKNHEVVIKALDEIKNPNIYYIICGQGYLENYLINLIKKFKLDNQVLLLGYRKDITELYKIADLFVFPSYREGLSVSLMEAMASGLAIICSNIRGNSDLTEEGKGGYLVKPKDVEEFARYITKMVSDIQLRENLGNFNRRKIENYSIQNVLKHMERIY